MTMEPLGWMQFKTHRAVVSKDLDTDRIYCFKHTLSKCEFNSFSEHEDAVEYIISPLKTLEFYVEISEDADA